jgi:hypothetical protein
MQWGRRRGWQARAQRLPSAGTPESVDDRTGMPELPRTMVESHLRVDASH